MKRITAKWQPRALKKGATKAVSCIASFALAFSMLGAPALAYATENGSENTTSEETVGSDSWWESLASLFTGGSSAPSADETSATNTEGSQNSASNASDSSTADYLRASEELVSTLALDEAQEEPVALAADNTGNKLTVKIVDARPFNAQSTKFLVALNDSPEYRQPAITELLAPGCYAQEVTFTNLPAGKCSITITADMFATYRQEVTIGDENSAATYAHSVKVYAWEYNGDTSGAHPGVITFGDFSNDGVIDSSDATALVDSVSAVDNYKAMNPDAAEADLPTSNLSFSGKSYTTLFDLQILAEAMSRSALASTLQTAALWSDANSAKVSENVSVVEGSSISSLAEVVGNQDQTSALKLQSSGGDISPTNPVTLELSNIDKQLKEGEKEIQAITVKPPVAYNAESSVAPGTIKAGAATVEYEENGQTKTLEVEFGDQGTTPANMVRAIAEQLGVVPAKAYAAAAKASIAADGTIVIDFGQKIAIKKVTLKVTKTEAANGKLDLAAISSVEFLNDTQKSIAPPVMNIPTDLQAEPGSKKFSVSWRPEQNVTFYELKIQATIGGVAKEQVTTVKNTNAERIKVDVTSFSGDAKGKVTNNTTYTLSVQSVNGEWRSGYSDTITCTPKATKAPDRPESVKARASYREMTVSWKNMEDTDYYTVYYRQAGEAAWKQVNNIESNSYKITGLKDETVYQACVTGHNEIGASPRSETAEDRTISINPAMLPQYKLVNTKVDGKGFVNHIAASSVQGSTFTYPDGTKRSSETPETGMAMFDDNYQSFMQVDDWDFGTQYGTNRGLYTTFDTPQELGFISFAAAVTDYDLSNIVINYVDDKNASHRIGSAQFYTRSNENGRRYFIVSLGDGIVAKQIQISMSRYVRYMNVAEIHFHGVDGIERDINALYTDEMHVQLNEGVTKETLDAIETRLNTPDPVSGEYNPVRALLKTELDYARQVLADAVRPGDTVAIDPTLSAAADSGKNLQIGGLNAWQPLGKAVAAEQEVIVYVSAPGAKRGSNAAVQLVLSQQNAESPDSPTAIPQQLKVGRNVVKVPKKISTVGKEHGGSLYAVYTGSNMKDNWVVRTLGAVDVPVLNLRHVTDQAEREARTATFIKDLVARVSELNGATDDAVHASLHSNVEGNSHVNMKYNAQHCILNNAEIQTDYLLYSFAATEVIKGFKEGNSPSVARVLTSVKGADQMMTLFYQHKGFMPAGPGVAKTNEAPAQHLNPRTMIMFAGAFMYAAGNHIGIGFSESSLLGWLKGMNDEALKVGSTVAPGGAMAGWGEAHEIGHNINDNRYAIAEVTNNYFAQICKYINENRATRWNYDAIYKHVTSGSNTTPGNVAQKLAMYWQLMVAHDYLEGNGNVYTVYDNYADLAQNRFFARVDAYSRNIDSAPKPNGIPLKLDGGPQQNIVRLACAASQRDLTAFFTAWGIAPVGYTKEYISQFPAETRAVQYAEDNAALWARANFSAAKVTGTDAIGTVSVNQGSGSVMTLSIAPAAGVSLGSIHGYEVIRVTYASGMPHKEIVGFQVADASGNATIVDNASHLGNRAVIYEVRAVDKFLNYSNTKATGSYKLNGTGLHSSAEWTATSNMVSADGVNVNDKGEEVSPGKFIPLVVEEGDTSDQCGKLKKNERVETIQYAIDGDATNQFIGKTNGEDPEIVIDMKATRPITSVRYTAGTANQDWLASFIDPQTRMNKYVISVSDDGKNFTQIGEGTIENDTEQIFFHNGTDDEGKATDWITTENGRYLKIVAKGHGGKGLLVKSLEVFGPSGDDVSFIQVDGQQSVEGGDSTTPVIGKLKADYQLDDKGTKIPAGSIVFAGTFKGNPAYNTVVLYDKKGAIVGGTEKVTNADGSVSENIKAHQVVLADYTNKRAEIGETATGCWVYWFEPGEAADISGLSEVRAELYRVDNALTNEGQRLVADSQFATVPSTLPFVTLTKSN